MTLYHYVHCPFCVRVRLVLGFLNQPYDSVVLKYNDEKTPIELTGQKMLPAFDFGNSQIINESLDIIKKIDQNNKLNFNAYEEKKSEIDILLNKIGKDVHSLCMPYWVWTPEFDEDSRKYFIEKKEVTRGPFVKLIQNKNQFLKSLTKNLMELEKNIPTFYKSEKLTLNDILIASHLWGMYIFPEFQFSEKIHSYLQKIKEECKFEYHADYWK